jgi:ribosomal protein S18 acetylase RimI-like enzyme
LRDDGIRVERADPGCADALALLDELSDALTAITGASGRASFDPADVHGARACFAIARDVGGPHGASDRALGCGALRPLGADSDGDIGEIKRMFARPGAAGVGSAVLRFLEAEAARLGYAALWLETRLVNTRAVGFYERRGYVRIANYGRYAGNAQAACFEKRLPAVVPAASART